MKRLPQQISLLAVSVFTVGTLAVAPVSARQGQDDTITPQSTSESGSGSSSISTGSTTSGRRTSVKVASEDSVNHTETENKTEHVTSEEAVTGRKSDLQERAQKLLATERQDKKVKSVDARQKSCEARQASLLKKSGNYTRNATKHFETFNKIYDKVLAFQADKQLTVANYDTLKASVDAKKTAATGAVAALKDAGVTIDCTSQDPAAEVATLKTAVGNARTALQDYRTSIKDLVVALLTAKADTTTSNTPETN